MHSAFNTLRFFFIKFQIHSIKTLQNHSKVLLSNIPDLIIDDGVAPITGLRMKVSGINYNGIIISCIKVSLQLSKLSEIINDLLMLNAATEIAREAKETIITR